MNILHNINFLRVLLIFTRGAYIYETPCLGTSQRRIPQVGPDLTPRGGQVSRISASIHARATSEFTGSPS